MLQSIRDNTQGWIAGTIISLLILSFAMWGIHSYLGGAGDTTIIAKVNGIEISKSQLGVAYERLRRQLQTQSNTALPTGAEVQLKEKALQTLINIQVLKQASVKQEYVITDGQVDSLLESMPEFQMNGVFSLARFQQVLSSTLFTAEDFLDLLKTSLLIDQPRLGIVFSSFALPNEIAESAALVDQERQIRYGILPISSLVKTSAIISPEKIKSYYENHQDDFKTQEQVSIEYIELSVANLMHTIHPTEQALKNYYNENQSMFSAAQKATDVTKVLPYDQVKNKVQQALTKQLAEEKFAELRDKLANIAYEHPDTLKTAAETLGLSIQTTALFTKEKGGNDLSNNAKIREAAFSNDVLESKNNSDAISLDPDSAIVLRVKSRVPAASLPLSAVEKQISDKLKTEEDKQMAEQQALEIKQALLSSQKTPDQIAQDYHFQWIDAGYISRHATKVDPAILNAAFSMPKPVNDQTPMYTVTKVPNGYAVIVLNGIKDGDVAGKADVFADQIQNAQGALEYDLYKESLMKDAKISVVS